MKILIYGLNYAPEPTGIGKYSAEMAESLASLGHDVRVICASPYYPHWRVSPGYFPWRYRSELLGAVRVQRAPVWVPARPSGLGRLVHLMSFAFSSVPLVLRQVAWSPDVILVVVPSLLNAPAAWLLGRSVGARTWLHVQDYEVDAAFALGLLKARFLRAIALRFERSLIRRFDVVSTISKQMVEKARNKGVAPERLYRLPNWVDADVIFPLKRASTYRALLGIPTSTTVVLYSGSLGSKHGLEVLIEAAADLQRRPDIRFVFCGSGPYKPSLEQQCEKLGNCITLDLQPSEHLNELLNLADIHVLPQRATVADLVMPSKLTGMLASGRAVIAMAYEGTEIFDVVSPRGIVIPPENPEVLADAIERLADSPDCRTRLGRAARRYAKQHLSRETTMAHLDERLKRLIGQPDARPVME